MKIDAIKMKTINKMVPSEAHVGKLIDFTHYLIMHEK